MVSHFRNLRNVISRQGKCLQRIKKKKKKTDLIIMVKYNLLPRFDVDYFLMWLKIPLLTHNLRISRHQVTTRFQLWVSCWQEFHMIDKFIQHFSVHATPKSSHNYYFQVCQFNDSLFHNSFLGQWIYLSSATQQSWQGCLFWGCDVGLGRQSAENISIDELNLLSILHINAPMRKAHSSCLLLNPTIILRN